MTDTFKAELRDLIDRAFTVTHSGRATANMLQVSVHSDLPDHLLDYLIGKGLKSEIRRYFGEKDSEGLPKRPAANEDDEHAQLELFTLGEFAFLHRTYVDRADANLTQAEKVRERCLDLHGVDLTKSVGVA